MATPNPASQFLSGEGTRNVPRSDSFLNDDPKCLDTSLNFFFINFCNIRGLRSNFQSVEYHLSSTKPHLLFLTETQMSEATDITPFSVPSCFLYSHFRSNSLESSEFSTIWLRLNMEQILSLYPFAEISIPEVFNVHHQLWHSSPFTDHPGELAFNFAILHDLERLVQHPTRIADRFGDTTNILDFSLPSVA
ncbi:hypothetical protein E2C01_032072 [Portunus trituberculatus]|uniref:Endonuclease/exonuclease/phosphatase domain-containing protein n=1 Tax=Portunus trituberculatus TaxID=210409 RepID=A0A5B7F0D2_PORTR|nr:hypothetical protein [Portunus trituberculatus]